MAALGIKDIEKEVRKMEYMLDVVEKTGAWPSGERSASSQLRQDLCFFTIFLAVSDKGIDNKLLDFINKVLRYNLNVNDVRAIIYGVDGDYCDVMLSGVSDVIIDACDAEDELRNRGMDAKMYLPKKLAELFGMVGKAFIGDEHSKDKLHAYALFMMKINSFLSSEGYYD